MKRIKGKPAINKHGIVLLKFKRQPTIKELLAQPCRNCGEKENISLHHIKPKMVGGKSGINLMPLCIKCHRAAHKIDAERAGKLGITLEDYYRNIYAKRKRPD